MSSPAEPKRQLNAFEARLLDDLHVFRAQTAASPEPSRVSPTTSRVLRRILITASAVLAAGGVAAAVVLTRPDATDLAVAGVACADRVDTRPDLTVVVSSGESPVDLCAELWRQGAVAASSMRVPRLTACVAKTGAVIVYPAAGDVCAQLGLGVVPEDFESASATITAFRTAVGARLDPAGRSCPGFGAALRIVRSEMNRHHLDDWRVRADHGSSGDCATIALDSGAKVVTVSRLQSR